MPEQNWPEFRLFEKVFLGELLRLLFLNPPFAIVIIIIINIMVVGWWCNAGVTRKREDPHNHLGGWWGQPANRNETGQQNNRRLPGVRITSRPSPGTLAQQAYLNKASPAQPAQRAPRGKEGEEVLMPVCLHVELS